MSASFSAGVVGSVIVTLTVVLSVDLSGYVTVIGTSNSPTVFPSGSLLGSSTVTFGCSPSVGYPGTVTFPFTSSSVTGFPFSFVIGSAFGSYLSASFLATLITAVALSVVPSL